MTILGYFCFFSIKPYIVGTRLIIMVKLSKLSQNYKKRYTSLTTPLIDNEILSVGSFIMCSV